MDETTQQDFFCTQCSLQFGKKYVFDVHLSLVHGKKDVTITNEGSKISFGESQKDGDSNTKNIENRKSFRCEICDYRCSKNSIMKKHVESVHDGKRPFEWHDPVVGPN